MMQFWISVLGNTASMAVENPVRLSVQAMRMFSIPRFFRLLSTVSQYLALSFSPSRCHAPRPGSTAWDYILVKRLIRARQLILSGVSITGASMRCGLRDYSAFYRAYKKRYTSSSTADCGRTPVGL